MKYFNLILFSLIIISCATLKEPTIIFVTDYLIFESEDEAEECVDLFFEADIETEYNEAIYDNKLVYIVEIQDLSLLDFELKEGKEWVKLFPEYYKQKIVRFEFETE